MILYYFPIAQNTVNKTVRDFFQRCICLFMYVHIFDIFSTYLSDTSLFCCLHATNSGFLRIRLKQILTSIIRDFMSPSSGPLILNICVAPLENLKATCLLERTDPAFFVSLVRVIFPLVPFSVTKTCKKHMFILITMVLNYFVL